MSSSAHLAKRSPRFRHHVWNTEGTADLDQFSPGDDDFPALGQRIQGKQDGRRVIVDDNGRNRRKIRRATPWRDSRGGCLHMRRKGFGEQFPEEPVHMNIALAAFAGFEVELKIRIRKPSFANVCQRLLGQWRAAQVGMQNNARRVDDWPQGET